MRMGMRRFSRLTNGFSKMIENQLHAVSLHFMRYNSGRVHKSLRVMLATMAAGRHLDRPRRTAQITLIGLGAEVLSGCHGRPATSQSNCSTVSVIEAAACPGQAKPPAIKKGCPKAARCIAGTGCGRYQGTAYLA